MRRPYFSEVRYLDPATVDGDRAPWMKDAPRRRVQGARHLAAEDHSLALAARELVRIPLGVLRQEPHVGEKLAHPLGALGAVGDDPVDGERLPDDLAHRHPRIERAVRILEDHLHLPSDRAQRVLVERREVAALEEDLTAGRPLELQDAASGGGLAAPGLAHEPEGLAPPDLEAHAVDGADEAGSTPEETAADLEMLHQVADLE